MTQGAGSAALNFSQGTLQAVAGFSTSVPIVLSTSGSNAVFQTSGDTLTLAGTLSGSGTLQEIGNGLLILSGNNTFVGGITVLSGTLNVLSDSALPSGLSLTIGAGTPPSFAQFSGRATWVSNSSSAWNNASNWLDNANLSGVPGVAPRPATTDTAAFSGSGSVTAIDLTGVDASLKALSFSNSSYTLSGGSLTLNSGSGMATVTVSGTQSIGSLLSLADSADMVLDDSTDLLTISGQIVGQGPLVKDGAGR